MKQGIVFMGREPARLGLLIFSLLALCACVRMPATEAEPRPVGYILEPVSFDEVEAPAQSAPEMEGGVSATASCVHQGILNEASEGLPVYPGDVISTPENGSVAVVFMDGSAITLRASSRLTISDYAYPRKRVATHVLLNQGTAFFFVTPRPDDAHFFVQTEMKHLVEVKGTKFTVLVSPQTNLTTVAVSSGTVTVAPNGASAVQLTTNNVVALNMNTTDIPGYTGATTNLTKTTLTPQQIKALQKNAIVDVLVSVNPKGVITIHSTEENADGTVTKVKRTELKGNVIHSVITVKSGKKVVFSENISAHGTTVKETPIPDGVKIIEVTKFVKVPSTSTTSGLGAAGRQDNTIPVTTGTVDATFGSQNVKLTGTVQTLADGATLLNAIRSTMQRFQFSNRQPRTGRAPCPRLYSAQTPQPAQQLLRSPLRTAR